MDNRIKYLLAVACLLVAGMLGPLSSFALHETSYASAVVQGRSNTIDNSAQAAAAQDLEPRVFLPIVTRNFCEPPTIPEDASLFGVIFFDYNGDGTQQPNEPGIVGAAISVGSMSTSSLCNGIYYFRNLPDGSYNLTVTAVGFRYLSVSTSDARRIGTSIVVAVGGSTQHDVGLMQGFLTLPFAYCPPFARPSPFGMTGMFDVDRRVGYVRSYDPENVKPDYESNGIPPWVYDQHDGIDYCFPEGTEIVAAAPGIVREIGFDQGGAGHYIVIHHPYDDSQTLYAHLSQSLISVGAQVSRGQLIAKSGNSGNSGEPHLHFRYGTWETPPRPIDPYRELSNPNSVSYWTVDNSPQYPH